MKGISYCDECANYDWENERCNKGASIEDDYDRIYLDCPLPDAELVLYAKWIDAGKLLSACKCSFCNAVFENKTKFCPNCGCKMGGE